MVVADPFEDLINCKDSDILPIIGDFSIIRNKFIRESLIHDFNFIVKNKMGIYLNNPTIINPEVFRKFKKGCYNTHNSVSLRFNLVYINYLLNHGWTEFIIKINLI